MIRSKGENPFRVIPNGLLDTYDKNGKEAIQDPTGTSVGGDLSEAGLSGAIYKFSQENLIIFQLSVKSIYQIYRLSL
jgi:hypothetical protein